MRAIIAGFVFMWGLGAALAVAQDADPPTTERLQAMLDEQGAGLTLGDYCVGDLTGTGGTEFAFAATVPNEDTGAYFAFAAGAVLRLADFTGTPELQCLDSSQAGQRDRAIRDSEGITGSVPETYSAHIVCGFIDNTEANCWAYDNSAKSFVKVGWWMT